MVRCDRSAGDSAGLDGCDSSAKTVEVFCALQDDIAQLVERRCKLTKPS